MNELLVKATRFLFFTGKGGVGKTSISCSVAVGLAIQGKRVLLISTDPASNLHDVLDTPLSSRPSAVKGIQGLDAMNINPLIAAQEYREQMVSPYRDILPEEAINQMEEQLSGACTVEIAGFNEFSKFIGDDDAIQSYDHVVLDTAPTGHTLRLLNLPSAWNEFIAGNETGSSCLGPVSGLADQKALYETVVDSLKDPSKTLLILVARAEPMSLKEISNASLELFDLGLTNQHVVLNGIYQQITEDPIGKAFAKKSAQALLDCPKPLKHLDTTYIPFRPHGVMGVESLMAIIHGKEDIVDHDINHQLEQKLPSVLQAMNDWSDLFETLEHQQHGVIMTMGKGGVGKTVIASAIAIELAKKGYPVTLSTTDPASHIEQTIGEYLPNLQVQPINPKIVTKEYCDHLIEKNQRILSQDDLELLEEELKSPCIEEIAVFQAFAKMVADGTERFVVLDTAPTGHTLLLLDATQAYHRELKHTSKDVSEEVKQLIGRIHDPQFTKILIAALPEATPMHEAHDLQNDLKRAGIEPFAWIINRSFALSATKEPVLVTKALHELAYISEISDRLSSRTYISPWIAHELRGETLTTLFDR